MASAADTTDIQALVKTGFGSLAARYLMFGIADQRAASVRTFLGSLKIASVADALTGKLRSACQIAFTEPGLRALGLGEALLDGFAPEFRIGMADDERRSHRLGDTGINAPDEWDWGKGPKMPHILLALYAEEPAIAAFEAGITAKAKAAGCETVTTLSSSTLDAFEDGNRREPFGFADGISQPDLDWDGALKPDATRDRDYRNTLAAGEVLLGSINEYGFVTRYPETDKIGLNGTYLAFRQLQQDVPGFWQWIAGQADPDHAIGFAERMVGRSIDGEPLPGLVTASGESGRNAFLYGSDPEGLACPIGSHIRRTNPRSGDNPLGAHGFIRDFISSVGLAGTAKGDAIASTRFHRILRRGRPYGKTLAPADAMRPGAPETETGLHFICLNANLARQFEFVQGAWVASATFAGLCHEQDPLLGNRIPFPEGVATNAFGYADADGCPRLASGLPQFVTVKGGAYFFLPGLAGLARILRD